MPEDVIARAIAEQAGRSPQELSTLVPGVIVALGPAGLAVARSVAGLLASTTAGRTARSALQLVVVGPGAMPVPEDLGADYVAVDPDWSPERIRLRHIDEWLGPDVARSRPDGAASRQADRLAFFSHFSEIRARLQAARDRALEPVRASATACTFYVVANLGDATGSGMVFDVAQLCRQLLDDLPDGRMVGYLMLPAAAVLDDSPLARPHAFAALEELDYFLGGGEFPVRYGAGAPTQALGGPPFSACYLLDGPRPGGPRAGDATATDLVALHIHADFWPGGVGCTHRAIRERLGRFARPGREDAAGCQAGYRGLGAARLFFDGDRHRRLCGLTVAARMLDRILDPIERNTAQDVSLFATPWSPGDLNGGLAKRLATPSAGPLKEAVREWPRQVAARLAADHGIRDLRGWLEARIEELAARFGSDGSPGGAQSGDDPGSAVARQVAEAVTAFESELDGELHGIGAASSWGDWFGPAVRFLDTLENRLGQHAALAAGSRERDEEVRAKCQAALQERLWEAERAWQRPFAHLPFGRLTAVEGPLAPVWRALEEWLLAELRLLVWCAMPAFHAAAQGAIRRRIQDIHAARGQLAGIRNRAAAALERAAAYEPAPGELAGPNWAARDVADLLASRVAPASVPVPPDSVPVPPESVPVAPADALGDLAVELLERCGAPTPLDLCRRLDRTDFGVRLAADIRAVAGAAVAGVPSRTVAERFLRLHGSDDSRRDALRRLLEAAAPRLELDTSHGAEPPASDACSLLVGIPGGPANPHGEFAEVLDLLLLALDDLGSRGSVSIADLPSQGEQILVLREVAGFPLRALAAIDDLAARYREHCRQPKGDPVHMAKDPGAFETVPGIFPPDVRTKIRALEAFAVGVQWGVFEVENGIVVHRQKLPGMTFLDTRIIGTLERPLRAVKYLIDHPELIGHAHGRFAEMIEEIRADRALRAERLGRLERYYLHILEQCRQTVIGADGADAREAPDGLDDVVKKLPLWDIAEAILAFNSRHGLSLEPEIDSVAASDASGAGLGAGRIADSQSETVAVVAAAAGSPPRLLCPTCGIAWPASAKFCAECATPLHAGGACRQCQAPLPPGGRFCPECAAPVGTV